MSQLASCVQSRIVRSAFGGGTRRGNDCDSRGRGWAAETWLFTRGDVTRRRENLPPPPSSGDVSTARDTM